MGNTFLDHTVIRVDNIANADNNGPPSILFGLRQSNGTVAAPSMSFTSSPTTGLFRKAADSVGFSAAGVEIGFYTNIGAWTFGPPSASVNHISNGSLSFPSTSSTSTAASIYQAGARIRLNGGASGYAFQNSNGTATHGLVESNGAWVLGDGTIDIGNQYAATHRIFGNVVFQLSNLGPSSNPNFSFSSSPRLMLGWNRTDGGQEVAFVKDGSSNATQAFHFYNATSNSATTFLGGTSSTGAWTFGPSSGFAGVLSHSFRGGVALEGNIAGIEYAANKFIMDTFQGGTRFFSCGGAPGPGNRGYFNWALLDSAGANALDVLACSGVGAWGVGPPGFTGTHTLRGGVTTGELRLGATSVGGGTYNNFSTANIGVILGVTGGCDFTGFANGATGKVLYIGVSNGGITLLHNSAASSVGNRIITLTGANLFRGNGGFTLVYDDNNSRWVQTG